MKDEQLLSSVFNETRKQSMLLGELLTKTDNRSMRVAILSQIESYDEINKSAGEEICALGLTPKSKGSLSDKLSVLGASISVGTNPSLSNIARTVTENSKKCTEKTQSVMEDCRCATPSAYNIARKLIASEEENRNRINKFL